MTLCVGIIVKCKRVCQQKNEMMYLCVCNYKSRQIINNLYTCVLKVRWLSVDGHIVDCHLGRTPLSCHNVAMV
jgi:hypothetical protein